MSSRTAVITGGNAGLGYAFASALLASREGPPWHVILACRNMERGGPALDLLANAAGARGRVEMMLLDLASLMSARAFATELTGRLDAGAVPPLEGLVCNAGVQSWTRRSATADGFEATFGVNHLGHFLRVNALLQGLKPPARIGIAASGVHDPANNWGLPAPA